MLDLATANVDDGLGALHHHVDTVGDATRALSFTSLAQLSAAQREASPIAVSRAEYLLAQGFSTTVVQRLAACSRDDEVLVCALARVGALVAHNVLMRGDSAVDAPSLVSLVVPALVASLGSLASATPRALYFALRFVHTLVVASYATRPLLDGDTDAHVLALARRLARSRVVASADERCGLGSGARRHGTESALGNGNGDGDADSPRAIVSLRECACSVWRAHCVVRGQSRADEAARAILSAVCARSAHSLEPRLNDRH